MSDLSEITEANNNKKKLLIVEDDAPLRTIMAESLSSSGFEVFTATNGKEGVDSALDNHPDLILLDIEMPVMNGLEALEHIRADEWGKNVPVLVLTNSAGPNTMFEAVNFGVTQYMVKANVDMKDLVKGVIETISSHSPVLQPRAVKGSFDVAPTLEKEHQISSQQSSQ